jgi:hypothetical protein
MTRTAGKRYELIAAGGKATAKRFRTLTAQLHPLYFPNITDIRAIPKKSLIRSSAAANAEVSTSAMNLN